MLKRIESIKDFGVFSDWKADADLPNFAQYNLDLRGQRQRQEHAGAAAGPAWRQGTRP
jgi:hypothetical protein